MLHIKIDWFSVNFCCLLYSASQEWPSSGIIGLPSTTPWEVEDLSPKRMYPQRGALTIIFGSATRTSSKES